MKPKKTKSGNYHMTAYIGTVDGKKQFKSITAPTYRECILKATEYINNHPVDGSDLTIRQAVEKYIQSKERVLSPSTIRGYDKILRLYLQPIYEKRVSTFSNYDFQSFVGSLSVAPKTVRNVYGLLRSALAMFSDKAYSVTLPEKAEPRRTVATEDDIKLLLDNADPELRKAIILGTCSLRRGEVAALKYQDIQDGFIYVHADIVKNRDNEYIYKDSAKTPSSTRRISVSDEIIAALGQGNGYVVDIINPDVITKRFARLRDSLGINVSFHSLRRFYASISHALGIPDKYIQKQGGWSSDTVMKKSYQHTLDKQEQEFQSKFNEKLSSLWS